MPFDKFFKKAQELISQGRSEILNALKQYGATADEADSTLIELQKKEKSEFDPKDF